MTKRKMSPSSGAAGAQEAEAIHYDRPRYTPSRRRREHEHPALRALRASLARAKEPSLRERLTVAIAALDRVRR
jgi:hypothetical protein